MDIVGKRRIFLSFSLTLVVLSAIILVSPGLKLGIDFTSGSTITFNFAGGDPGTARVKAALDRADHPEAVVQAMGDNQYFVRTDDLGNSGLDAIIDEVNLLAEGPAAVLDTSTVGSSVAEDTVKNAVSNTRKLFVGFLRFISSCRTSEVRLRDYESEERSEPAALSPVASTSLLAFFVFLKGSKSMIPMINDGIM